MTNKEAIKHLNNKLNIAYFTAEDNEALDMAIKALEELEERPTVEWICKDKVDGHMFGYSCSNCGNPEWKITRFCPNCGAYMKGAKE